MRPQSLFCISQPCVCNRQWLFEHGQHMFFSFWIQFQQPWEGTHSGAGIWMVLASFGLCRSQRAVHPSVCSRVPICMCTPIPHLVLGLEGDKNVHPLFHWRPVVRGVTAGRNNLGICTWWTQWVQQGFCRRWLLINQCSLINYSALGLCLSHPQTSGGKLEGKCSARPKEPDVCHHTEGMSRCRTSPAFLPARLSCRLWKSDEELPIEVYPVW